LKNLFFKTLFAIIATSFLFASSIHAAPAKLPESAQKPANGNGQKKQNKIEWQEFTADESGFSVMLPTKPDHIQQSIDVPNTKLKINYDTYVSEPSDSVVYVVSVWHYPSEIDMSHPEVNLQDGFGGML